MKARYYVSNKEMLVEMIEYKETGIVSEELGGMIFKIAKNFSNKGNFSSYTWKEDMVGEAILTCLKYMHNFDAEKSSRPNPFAYFTQICYNSFINFIRKQKKHSKIKDICYKNQHLIAKRDGGYFFTDKGIDYQILKND